MNVEEDYGPDESGSDEESPPFAVRNTQSPSGSSAHDEEPQYHRRMHIDERHRLILKLSKEMVKLVTSLTQGGKMDPSEKRFTWEEWQRWLRVLESMNEREQGAEREEKKESTQEESTSQSSQLDQAPRKEGGPPTAKQRPSPPALDSDKAIAVFSPDNEGWKEDEEVKEDRDRAWLWLSDEGPLFSRVPEPVWIMEKLNDMLEKVVLREEGSLNEEGKESGHDQPSRRHHSSTEDRRIFRRSRTDKGRQE
jgi:potassium channel subfamily K, other eukaryote